MHRLGIALTLLLTMQGALLAQSVPAPAPGQTAELKNEDIAAGLKSLAAAMAWPTAKARWVTVNGPNSTPRRISLLQMDSVRVDGHGWLIGEQNGHPLFLSIAGDRVELTPLESTEEQDFYINLYHLPTSVPGVAVPADIKADVGRFQKSLKQAVDDGGQYTGARFREDPNVIFRCIGLCWAAQLHETELKEEAIILARTAFSNLDAPQREEVLNYVFNIEANRIYLTALNKFAEDKDWGAFAGELEKLLVKFPRGWVYRDAAVVLQQKAKARQSTPNGPLQPAHPLKPEEIAVLTKWFTSLEEMETLDIEDCWLLPPAQASTEDEEEPDEASAADSDSRPKVENVADSDGQPPFPRSMGLAAVPLLAAMLTDDTPIHFFQVPEEHFRFEDPRNIAARDVDEAESLRLKMAQLPRPISRAEIAQQALTWVIRDPSLSDESANSTGKEKAEAVMAWWNEVKTYTPTQLALHYVENESHLDQAMVLLAQSEDKKIQGQLEELLLAQVEIYSLEKLAPYISSRGEGAKPFLQKLESQLIDAMVQDGQDEVASKKRVSEAMRSLQREMSLSNTSAESILDSIIAGETKLEDSQSVLSKALAKMNEVDRFKLFLQKAVQVPDPQFTTRWMWTFVHPAYTSKLSVTSLNETQRKALLQDTRAEWEKLLAGKVAGEFDSDEARFTFCWSMAVALDTFLGGNISEHQAVSTTLGRRGQEILLQRGKALLAGETPPPLPSASQVPATEVDKIWNDLLALPPDEVNARTHALAPAAFLAIAERQTQEAKLPDALLNAQQRISLAEVKLSNGSTWTSWVGKNLDKAALYELLKQAVPPAADGDGIQVTLTRPVPSAGWILHVQPIKSIKTSPMAGLFGDLGELSDEMEEKLQTWTCSFVQIPSIRESKRGVWMNAPPALPKTPTTPEPGKESPAEDTSEAAPSPEAALAASSKEYFDWVAAFDETRLASSDAATIYIITLNKAGVASMRAGDEDEETPSEDANDAE